MFDPIFIKVLIGTLLLAASSSVVGVFSFLKGESLVGDAIAHALLPGVVLAFIIGDGRNPVFLILGALVAGLTAHYGISFLEQRTKLKGDTAISLVLSTFFGFGIMLLSAVQRTGQGQQAGLERFLLGKAAAITLSDLYVFGALALVLLASVALFFKGFQLMTFNEDFAAAIGLPIQLIRFVFTVLTVLAVTVGIQSVGVVLILSSVFAATAAVVGTIISASLPKMPTGPWIVLALGGIAFISLLIAPENGWLPRRKRARGNQLKTQRENLLKLLYGAEEREGHTVAMTSETIVGIRRQHLEGLRKTLRSLKKEYLLVERADGFALTEKGRTEGRRVVRLHRLWELYLTERLGMAADHIHPQAETMEHIITPEIEALIVKELGNPELDPHQSPIPYEED